jgi:phage terminase small subunit
MACNGLASATANSAAAAGIFSCTAPTAAANLAGYWVSSATVPGTSWVCKSGSAAT